MLSYGIPTDAFVFNSHLGHQSFVIYFYGRLLGVGLDRAFLCSASYSMHDGTFVYSPQ